MDKKTEKICSFCNNISMFSAVLYDQGIVTEAEFCSYHAQFIDGDEIDRKKQLVLILLDEIDQIIKKCNWYSNR